MRRTETTIQLRRSAEEKVASHPPSTGETDAMRLLHELQVHQIELEMQNEALRQANAEINEHKEHLLNIIKKTPAGYFHIDREGRFLDVNDAWLHMHGYDSADEVVGKHFSMMQIDGSSDSALAHLEELQRGIPIPYGEFRSRRKDGSVGHHIFSAHPVERMGAVTGFEWFIIDITERRKLEEVQAFLLQSVLPNTGEKFFYSLARYLAKIMEMEYVCIDRLSGDCLSAQTLAIYNEGHFEDNVSYTLKDTPCGEVAGKNVCCFTRNVCEQFPNDAVLQELKAESYIGTTLWSSVGKPIGLIAVIGQTPLVNSRQAETILNLVAVRAAAELERIKADEKREKLQEQLSQTQKIESIGQLAGGVAHDFNNMLGVILGHTELALRKADPANPFIPDLEEIRTAANRSADLTRQLLTFARKQVIVPKVLDLNETVAGILKMLQRLIGENIQLSWNATANLWPVKIDPSQVDQILANLCVNARDAIAGIGKISIKTENSAFDENASSALPYDVVPGDYVRLSVNDDGCGMDKEVQAHIFEPFYTTKEAGSGTGLGLSTVYGAVKQNHGFLTVYSEPGLGTAFNVYLPRASTAVEVKQETAEKPLLRGAETVLLVEDDMMLLRLEKTMLEESGYTVLPAITTDLAQTLAKDHPGPIHLLISDMIMPTMNGRELSVRLQLLRPEMKTLFMSGYTADIISKQGVVEDEIHFLQKPFSFEALTTKVREVLDDH